MLPIFENILDICCQHLEKISNFEGFCLGNEHILLDICCQHLRIYWIYDANTWGMNVLLDICCQHLEKICNFEGFCLGNEHISLDICCQHLRIYVSWRVSVGPSGPGLGNVLGDEFVLKVACPKCRCPQRHVLYVVCPQCPIGINIRLTWCLI